MKKITLLLFALAFSVHAQAAVKSCEALKEEITAKLEAKGVPSYTLRVVPIGEDAAGRQVGTCDGGTMKIMYVRG